MKFSGVTILQGVEFSIFSIDFEWALQQCSATALPVMTVVIVICLSSSWDVNEVTNLTIYDTNIPLKAYQRFLNCLLKYIVLLDGSRSPRKRAILGVVRPIQKHWQSVMRGVRSKRDHSILNAMRTFVKFLWPIVIYCGFNTEWSKQVGYYWMSTEITARIFNDYLEQHVILHKITSSLLDTLWAVF